MNLEIFKQRIFVLQQLTKRELKRKILKKILLIENMPEVIWEFYGA